MTTIAESRLALHDTKIAKARAAQLAIRQAWAHSPCAANVRAEEQAQERVDELLDRRLTMTRETAAG